MNDGSLPGPPPRSVVLARHFGIGRRADDGGGRCWNPTRIDRESGVSGAADVPLVILARVMGGRGRIAPKG